MEAVTTARDALSMLEIARASMGMSKAELARRGRLPPETVRRLLTSNEANPHFSMVADLLKPAGLGLFVALLTFEWVRESGTRCDSSTVTAFAG